MLMIKIHSIFRNSVGSKFSIEFIREELKEKYNKDYSFEYILKFLIKNNFRGMFCPTSAKCIVWKKIGDIYSTYEYKEEYCPLNQYISTAYWNSGLSIDDIDKIIYSAHKGKRTTLTELIHLIEKVTKC